jgi:glycosyltransferase involved in cell wall biosynthesis
VIGEQLAALQRQTCLPDLEIIVVDDGSDDATADVVAAWVRNRNASEFTLVRRPDRGGPNAARNVGLSMANAEIVLFCDGDDVVDDAWADAMIDAFRPGVILSGPYLRLGGDPNESQDWLIHTRTFLGWEYALGGNLGVERSLAISIGGFDESIPLGGTEVEFCIRAQLMANARVIRVNDAIVNHRCPTGATQSIARAFRRERGHAYIHRRYRHRAFAPPLTRYLGTVKDRAVRCLVLFQRAREPYPHDRFTALGRLAGVIYWPVYARFRTPAPTFMTRDVRTRGSSEGLSVGIESEARPVG